MRVLLTGGRGMLGRTVAAAMAEQRPSDELVAVDRERVDLRDPSATERLVREVAPDVVLHAAAKVGGVADKKARPAEYLLDNVQLDTSVVRGCLEAGVRRFVYVGSAAFYPEAYDHPFREDEILTGRMEGVNEPYALAKAVTARLCAHIGTERALPYRVLVPSNLYGPFDHFDPATAHLVGAALAKVHRAHTQGEPSVEVWGDGTARREFTYAPDLAAWLVRHLDDVEQWPVSLNLGCGDDHTVREYYEVACRTVGYTGELRFRTDMPGGAARRLIDSSAARALGWAPTTTLEDGMRATYRSFLTTIGESVTHV